MTGRGLIGRRTARALLVLAVGLDVLVLLFALSRPADLGPMFDEPPAFPVGPVVVAVGIALNVLGLVWMVRIVRADPEGGPTSWRAFRDR
jgi:Flp pilus assembly protein TadB